MNRSPTNRATPAPDPSSPPAAAELNQPLLGMRSSKIQPRHLERLAIVYVRQSSPQQVLQHGESKARQYALADYAVGLGWPTPRVLVIDDDQGHSGKSAADRSGFQRLLAEVTLDHVGLVLGLEMSRLARSSTDWHHLIETCALFGTLLGDQDGLYDAHDPNDRLLLGLKGAMSEAELFTMRNRLERGKLHKVQRGALFTRLPTGYVLLPSGEVDFDPDEQVQAIIHLVFTLFDELGTAFAVQRYLLDHRLHLGFRVPPGDARGQLHWRPPTWSAVYGILKSPLYAGAYVYGRRQVDPRRSASGQAGVRTVPPEQWTVLLRDRLPAYITWERYQENQKRMHQNRTSAETVGVPRSGTALLAGLLRCGRCGRRMQASYPKTGRGHYLCTRHQRQPNAAPCGGVAAAAVDDLVAEQVLRALQPAALELSLQAAAAIQDDRARLDRCRRQELERARYEAERWERQYQAVEPENRLVARTLERRWEEALQREKQLQEEYDRWRREQPPQLSAAERRRIQSLAEDIPSLWQAAGTTMADRKEIVRCLVERVEVQVQPDSEQTAVTIVWQGGWTSRHQVARAVLRYEQLHDYGQLRERVAQLRRDGLSATTIAARLNAEGFTPPHRRGPYTKAVVHQLLTRHGLRDVKPEAAALARHEWWVSDLADALGLSPAKVRRWIRLGWVQGRQVPGQGQWVAWADGAELRRLRKLKARSRQGGPAYPQELITPKNRPKT
jgi:DNA invertase Pin-like site-specific DNA recombinase